MTISKTVALFLALIVFLTSAWNYLSASVSLSVLLVVAYLVPGVLLHWEMLRESAWIDVRR
jgi:hypothetical protein